MSTALVVVIILLVMLIMLVGVAMLMHYLTRQDVRSISSRLDALDQPKLAAARTPDSLRRERSAAYDALVKLEAGLSSLPREELTPEEMAAYEEARRAVKACNAELQQAREWMGLPYDLEWADIKERTPRLTGLYRQAMQRELLETPAAG